MVLLLLLLLVLCRAAFTPNNRTLEVRPGRISRSLELHYDYNVKGMIRLWNDKIRLLNFASRFIYSVHHFLACSFMVLDSYQLSHYFNEANSGIMLRLMRLLLARRVLRKCTGSEPRSINISNRLPSALGGTTYMCILVRAYATYRLVTQRR